eukprot:scaffold214090_cov20-Prasinocladus_malaysianus.AAC.1
MARRPGELAIAQIITPPGHVANRHGSSLESQLLAVTYTLCTNIKRENQFLAISVSNTTHLTPGFCRL